MEVTTFCGESLQQDPMARASYSSNPQFIKGAAEAHPINSARKSQLVQPLVAEALEAVYLSDVSETPADQLSQVDLELAVSGLNWLRKNVDKEEGSQLRRRVIATKSSIATMEWSQQIHTEREQAHREQAQHQADERRAAAQAEKIKQAEAAQREAQQANYYAALEERVGQLRESHPNLDFENYLGLCEEISLFEEHEEPVVGGSIGKEKRGFQSKLLGRVADYLHDPQELVNDLAIIRLLHDQVANPTVEPSVYAYNTIIALSISQLLDKSHYTISDFSPEIVNAWLDIAVTDEPAAKTYMKKMDQPLTGDPDTRPADIEIDTPAILYGGRIIANTLKEVARQHPGKLVDTMYMMAKEGMAPESTLKHRATAFLLTNCLINEPLATPLLHLSTVSQNNEALRQKALDLQQTLRLLEVPDDILGFGKDGLEPSAARLGLDELKILHKLFKRELNFSQSTNARDHTLRLDELRTDYMQEFIAWTMTPDGVSNSLLSRFLAQRQIRKAHSLSKADLAIIAKRS
jgi:hypothetical protein